MMMLNSCSEPRSVVNDPLLGAIRWDAWRGDAFRHGYINQRVLDAKQFHERVPFYGEIVSDSKINAGYNDQATMDQEIQYAAGALDYWAFLDYPSWFEKTAPMNIPLQLYLKSEHKENINFCIIFNMRGWSQHIDLYVQYFKEASYQRVDGGRPLMYVYNVVQHTKNGKACEQFTQSLNEIKQQSIAQGAGDPYVVYMEAPWVFKYRPDIFDNIPKPDAYSCYAHQGNRKPFKQRRPYVALADESKPFWGLYKEYGYKQIPLCMAGWDPSPRAQKMGFDEFKDVVQRHDKGDYNDYDQGSPEEIAAHIKAAIEWSAANPESNPVNTYLIYSWNEFSEGGYLCPTLREGDARLRAIEAMRLKLSQ